MGDERHSSAPRCGGGLQVAAARADNRAVIDAMSSAAAGLRTAATDVAARADRIARAAFGDAVSGSTDGLGPTPEPGDGSDGGAAVSPDLPTELAAFVVATDNAATSIAVMERAQQTYASMMQLGRGAS